MSGCKVAASRLVYFSCLENGYALPGDWQDPGVPGQMQPGDCQFPAVVTLDQMLWVHQTSERAGVYLTGR